MKNDFMWPSDHKRMYLSNDFVIIFRKAITFEESEIEKIENYSLKGQHIFNPDKKRKQRPIPKSSKVSKRILTFLKDQGLLNNRYVGGMVTIHSLSGCQQQAFHTDYDPEQVKHANIKPLGVLTALNNNTKFLTTEKTYHLNKGDILCFAGDVVHAGAGYDNANTRIHIYLDVDEISRIKNRTWLIT